MIFELTNDHTIGKNDYNASNITRLQACRVIFKNDK
jgi:hypothetical protein